MQKNYFLKFIYIILLDFQILLNFQMVMSEENFLEKAKYSLKKAVENDGLRRHDEAVEHYITGIDFLYKHINSKIINI